MFTLLLSLLLTGPYDMNERVDLIQVQSRIKWVSCHVGHIVTKHNLIDWGYASDALQYFDYDTNGDTNKDVRFLLPRGDMPHYPIFYLIDIDYNGTLDISYHDKFQDGTCKGMVVYKVMDPTRHEGTPIPPQNPPSKGKES